jgi:hypothetical protein
VSAGIFAQFIRLIIFIKQNILRRVKSLMESGADGSQYGVTLAAYGDANFNQQWEELMADLGNQIGLRMSSTTKPRRFCRTRI